MTQPPPPSAEALTLDSPAVLAKPRRRASWSRTQWAWFVLISAAYLLRLILMPVTGQNDLVLPAWKAHYINQGHWNIYAYMAEVYDERNVVTDHPPAAYPYGFYAVTAGWLEVLRRAGFIDFDGWSAQWAISSRAWWFLLLKLPYLASDLVIGVLLFRAAPSGRGLLAWAGWAWSLSGAYLLLMGQNDLYPTLFTVGAAWLGGRALQAQRANRPQREGAMLAVASMALLGLGATFKIIPLALAAPFALVLASRWRDRLLLTAIPAVIFGASAAPFIATPAFVNGVLFNWEGVRVFSAAQIFASPVSLFVMAYVALLIVLIARPVSSARPIDLWAIGAVVFSGLFLFSWSQFYWAIWLTPFVVTLIALDSGRWRYWLTLWLIIEATFAVLLFSMHRDFSIGLLASASLSFRLAQFDAVIALFAPALQQPVEIVWTVARSAQTTARLLVFAGALGLVLLSALPIWRRYMRPGERNVAAMSRPGVLVLPALAGALAAIAVLGLSRHAVVREFGRNEIARVALSAEQPAFEQTIAPVAQSLTGLLLLVSQADSAALPGTMQVCATSDASKPGASACSQGRLIQTGLFYGYGFVFTPPLPATEHPYRFVFRLIDPASDARVALAIVTPPASRQQADYTAEHGNQARTGVARLTLLRAFDTGQALQDMSSRLAEDGRLPVLWLLSLGACLAVIGWVVTAAPNDDSSSSLSSQSCVS